MKTNEFVFVENRPSKEGEKIGAQLARLTENQLTELRKKFPKHHEPCGTCAFRRGTVPNRCLSTVMDAIKCVMEVRDFNCHESHGRKSLCCGWLIAIRYMTDKGPIKVPWEMSLSPEQIEMNEEQFRKLLKVFSSIDHTLIAISFILVFIAVRSCSK